MSKPTHGLSQSQPVNFLGGLEMFDKFTKLRSVLTVLIFLVGAVVLLNQTATNPATATDGATSIIVELKDEPGAVYKARAERAGQPISDAALQSYRDQLRAKQDQFLSALSSSGVSATAMSRNVKNPDGSSAATVQLRYTLVLNGVALKVPRSAISTIESMPQVKKVHMNDMLQPVLNKSVDYIRAPKVYGAVKHLGPDPNIVEGYEGYGVNIAVLDTGIDWTHPMFGGDPTPPRLGVAPEVAAVNTNKKVIYYLPLTDIAVNDGFGHGTHVASIAAGYVARHPGADGVPLTGDEFDLHGVAPQARLMSYTVCSNIRSIPGSLGLPSIGGCEAADIALALEDSVSPFTLTGLHTKPVAHVINLSLGGGGGPDNVTAIACSNAALTGATVVAASGNSGPGEGSTGSPAAGVHVISVGATTHPGAAASLWSGELLQASAFPQATTGAITPANNFSTAAGFNRITLFPMQGSSSLPASSMAQRYAYVSLAEGTWPASVRGRIALVRDALGATNFDIIMQAFNAGAVGVIVFDSRGTVNGVKTLIPAATIAPEDGEVLVDALSSTDNNAADPPNGTVSELPIRMNPFTSASFVGEMADFSSRGPVRGLGQVKPDVSAPGVAVLAAAPPASVVGALGALENTPQFAHLDGTSMATPHVAGVVALIKQAHPNWSPDIIRTVLINTATNMRDQAGAPKADGHTTADSIIAQGGGLVDVPEAVNAKALMGITNSDPQGPLDKPAILGSHSFGEVPVINNRVTHTAPITVTIRDLSGQGGTYDLAVANNRDLQLAGISVSTSQASVNLPAGGEAAFTVNATVDGDLLRDTMAAKIYGTSIVFEQIQMQWFVTARRSDGGESLRMPFFFRPGPSMPNVPIVVTTSVTDIMPAGDAGAQRDTLGFQPELNGVTYKDIEFPVDASTFRIEAATDWMQVGETGQTDIDYQLLGPDGEIVAQSGNGVGGEFVSVTVTQPGTYTHRVIGFSSVATEFTVTTTLTKGNAPPVMQGIAGDYTNAQGSSVDFDGSITLSWLPTSGATGYEVERSTDGTNYELIGSTNGATTLALTNQPDGELSYRVSALAPGQIGFYVTAPSNAASILIDRRSKVDITASISTAMSNVSFTGGVFRMDLNITNNSTSSYVPLVELNIVGITSASGTVSVKNADNGGNGKSLSNAALFGYSNLLGADQEFTAAEITGNRTLQFNDQAAELFSLDVVVTAFQRGAGGGGEGAGAAGAPAGGGAAAGSSGTNPLSLTKVMRITVNPLTKAVSAKLL
jgi:subtilisin family serine protease